MELREFESQVPFIIEHTTHGYGELEIVINTSERKGVCYRHKNKIGSLGTYGETWQEVYDDLMPYLKTSLSIKGNVIL